MSDNDPQPPVPPRKRATGRSLGWSEADIAKVARVTQDDLTAARDWWRKYSSPKGRDLLDAKPAPEPETRGG